MGLFFKLPPFMTSFDVFWVWLWLRSRLLGNFLIKVSSTLSDFLNHVDLFTRVFFIRSNLKNAEQFPLRNQVATWPEMIAKFGKKHHTVIMSEERLQKWLRARDLITKWLQVNFFLGSFYWFSPSSILWKRKNQSNAREENDHFPYTTD